jgi:flagellar motility protein MotE (MotC chaperone)
MTKPKTLIKSGHLLPILGLSCALAIGVHAGEAVKSLKNPALQDVAKVKAPMSRAAVDLTREATLKSVSSTERERQIQLREGLLAASESRLNAKLAELKALEEKSKSSTAQVPEKLNSPILAVVKIYEAMKPKDAARIFEKLDLNVQLSVASKMKERAVAALLAEMSPDAARRLTMEMVAKASFNPSSS